MIARAQNVQSHDRLAIGGQAGALQTQAHQTCNCAVHNSMASTSCPPQPNNLLATLNSSKGFSTVHVMFKPVQLKIKLRHEPVRSVGRMSRARSTPQTPGSPFGQRGLLKGGGL